MANLGRLTGLKQLYIGGGAYTDAGVASLLKLTGLTDLGIGVGGVHGRRIGQFGGANETFGP